MARPDPLLLDTARKLFRAVADPQAIPSSAPSEKSFINALNHPGRNKISFSISPT